jgi:hypothetical protein
LFHTSIHSYFSIFNMIMLSQVNDDKEKGVSVGTKSVSEQLVEVVPGGEGAAARGGQRRGLGLSAEQGRVGGGVVVDFVGREAVGVPPEVVDVGGSRGVKEMRPAL